MMNVPFARLLALAGFLIPSATSAGPHIVNPSGLLSRHVHLAETPPMVSAVAFMAWTFASNQAQMPWGLLTRAWARLWLGRGTTPGMLLGGKAF
jgi:hypothetical protein